MVSAKSTKENYLTSKQVQQIIPFSRATIRRLDKDNAAGFPKSHKVGRSAYWKESSVLDFLSQKAGFTVTSQDQVITAKDLQAMFDKSHTWLWQNIKNKTLPEPFLIGRSRFWMKSQIDALDTSTDS